VSPAKREILGNFHHYRRIWRGGGRCHIAVYAPEAGEEGRCPVIVAAERDDNAGSSVTTMAAYLAATVVARHVPHLLDAPAAGGQPVVWREHDPPGRGERGAGRVRPRDLRPVAQPGDPAGGNAAPGTRHPRLGAARPRGGGGAARAARDERRGVVTRARDVPGGVPGG